MSSAPLLHSSENGFHDEMARQRINAQYAIRNGALALLGGTYMAHDAPPLAFRLTLTRPGQLQAQMIEVATMPAAYQVVWAEEARTDRPLQLGGALFRVVVARMVPASQQQ